MAVVVQERVVAEGMIETVLAMCLGADPAAPDCGACGERPATTVGRIDPPAGTVHWDAIVAMGPDWNAGDFEMEWLGI